jgi:hypothetical protein
MVSLAKRLQGKPFHLVASYCQGGAKDDVLAYALDKGITADNPNLTITKQGRHPDVKGNGYVPYYMVFDHTGKLVQHHMCGAYHGGDGNKFIEWVDKLMANAPKIYLGAEPYTAATEFAERISAGRSIANRMGKVAAGVAGDDAALKAECERITTWVTKWRDRRLQHVDRLLAREPAEVVGELKSLARDLKGHALAADVDAKLQEFDGSKGLKDAIAIAKKWKLYRGVLARTKCCPLCAKAGLKTFRHGCSACSAQNAIGVGMAKKQLERVIDGHEDLPITATVLEWIAGLE